MQFWNHGWYLLGGNSGLWEGRAGKRRRMPEWVPNVGARRGCPLPHLHQQYLKPYQFVVVVVCPLTHPPQWPRVLPHLGVPPKNWQVRAGGRVKGVRNGNQSFQGRTSHSQDCTTFPQELTHLKPGGENFSGTTRKHRSGTLPEEATAYQTVKSRGRALHVLWGSGQQRPQPH